MAGEMRTDAATLSAEAANFETISNDLQTEIRNVDAVGAELASQWTGRAGTAAQEALVRFREAGQAQIKALEDISRNIQTAGIQYSASDDEQASSLSSQMNF